MILPTSYLKTTIYYIYNSNVKRNIKIVSLSDLHISEITDPNYLEYLKYHVYSEFPDYICILGDTIDDPEKIEAKDGQLAKNFIKSLSIIAPIIIILGNHDIINNFKEECWNKDYWQDIASINNVFLLDDEKFLSKDVMFMGYTTKYSYYWGTKKREDLESLYKDLLKLKKLYTELPTTIPKIGLIHSPKFYQDDRISMLLKEFDLIISGHVHNGCMPAVLDNLFINNRGIISPDRDLFPKVARGITTLPTNTNLILNGGITKIQHSANKLIRPLNHLCYQQMDNIILTGDESVEDYKVSYKRARIIK